MSGPVHSPVRVPGDLCCPGLSGLGLGQPVSQPFGKRRPLPLTPATLTGIGQDLRQEPASLRCRSTNRAPGQWPPTHRRPKGAQVGHGWTCPPQLGTANSESHQPSFAHRSPGGLDPYHISDAATSCFTVHTCYSTSSVPTRVVMTQLPRAQPTLFVVKLLYPASMLRREPHFQRLRAISIVHTLRFVVPPGSTPPHRGSRT